MHLWYVMSVGLVPDRIAIAEGISALLILLVFAFNILLMVPLEIWRRKIHGE